jgi:hypothetical protein
MSLGICLGPLFVVAFTESQNLAYIAFVMRGIGIAIIFPLNGFQDHLFSLNVKKCKCRIFIDVTDGTATALLDGNNDNNYLL